jgi:hypothetical protein
MKERVRLIEYHWTENPEMVVTVQLEEGKCVNKGLLAAQ